MANNILEELSGNPTTPTNYIPFKEGAEAILNTNPLKITKTEAVKQVVSNPNAIVIDKNQLIKYALIGAILYIVFIK